MPPGRGQLSRGPRTAPLCLLELAHRGQETCLHGKEPTCVVKADESLRPADSHMSDLRDKSVPIGPADDFTPGRRLSYNPTLDLEPEAPAHPQKP